MNNLSPQHTLLLIKKHALLVTLICFIPHFLTAPWWLFLLVLTAVAYRLIGDYFGYPLLNRWIRVGLVLGCLILLKIQYGRVITSGFFIGFLLTFIGLKIIEIHTHRDLKVLIFCNFYLIFSALIVIQELWIIVYLLIALLANLSLMLKINAPQASFRQIGGKSLKQLFIAIPLSIILFYIFPRIAPLWHVPSLTASQIGFNESMNPGSIADLASNDSTALRITFKNKPILDGYWRGLVLSYYNGISWKPNWYATSNFPPLPKLGPDDVADYEIILEPHQKKWLFYLGYPKSGRPSLLFSPDYGLVSQKNEIIDQRFTYGLQIQSPTYNELIQKEILESTKLPKNFNPRIKIWATEQFNAVHHDPQVFVLFLQNYIRQNPFWYTLKPAYSANKNQVDHFWFDSQKGFCEHYASAVTVILRSVGIPARVVVGYQGGTWNPIGEYLTVKQNNAHAWLEYWQKNRGWQEFDPTAFIAPERIDQTITKLQGKNSGEMDYLMGVSWIQRLSYYFDSARFFTERWLLFYNQETQQRLLQEMGISQWDAGQLLQAAVFCLVLFLFFAYCFYLWRQKRGLDPLWNEYRLLQKEFKRFGVSNPRSATLKQQCESFVNKVPRLSSLISSFLNSYEQLRLQKVEGESRRNKKETVLLFKTLRKKIKSQSGAK